MWIQKMPIPHTKQTEIRNLNSFLARNRRNFWSRALFYFLLRKTYSYNYLIHQSLFFFKFSQNTFSVFT